MAVIAASSVVFTVACGDEGVDDTAVPEADAGTDAGSEDPPTLSFFVTSEGTGALGSNLGGLAGADARCQSFAAAAGAGDRTWRAYLSTSTANARDRVGEGPWFNAAGRRVAEDVNDLVANGIRFEHILDEEGGVVPLAEHDVLTGTHLDGRVLVVNGQPMTCADWTSNRPVLPTPDGTSFVCDGVDGLCAVVGHTDDTPPGTGSHWSTSHYSGCDAATMAALFGTGRLYCFAAR